MDNFCSRLLDTFLKGDKKEFSRIMIIVLILVIVIPFAINYFYGNTRLEQQIKLLNELSKISKLEIKDQRLQNYYDSIVTGLVNNKPQTSIFDYEVNYPYSLVEYFTPINVLKFLSGSIWFFILLVSAILTKQETRKEKISVIISMTLLTILFGVGGVFIPTFEPFSINLLGLPYFELLLVVIIALIISKVGKPQTK